MRLLLAIALAALPGGCKQAPAAPTLRVQVGAARTQLELREPVVAFAAGPGELFAAGTAKGEVVLHAKGAAPRRLEAVHDGPVVALAFAADGSGLLSAGGRVAAWWDLPAGKLAHKVQGPQQLTAAALRERPGGLEVYFGTAQGSMLRWDPSTTRATPLRDLACPAWPVNAEKRTAPEAERCPYGTYVEAEDGSGAACVYAVTAIGVAGVELARACREGSLHLRDLASGKGNGATAGFLRTLTPLQGGRWLLGRDEGELRVFDAGSRAVVKELRPSGTPDAAAASGELLAAAHGGVVRLWQTSGPAREPAASVEVSGRVVWLQLQGAPPLLRVLDGRGRLSAYSLTLSHAAPPR